MAKHPHKSSHESGPVVGKVAHLQGKTTKKGKPLTKSNAGNPWPETNLRGANPRKY